jgi:subtilisin family serine protease
MHGCVAGRARRALRGIAATATLAGALVAMTATAAAADTTPALDAEVAAAGATERIPVIAVLSDRVDGERFAGSDAALLRTLRERARRSQPAVLRAADIAIGRDDLERFWLVNAVALDATTDEIAALADAPGVDRVALDPTVRVADGPQVGTMALSSPGLGNWGIAAIRADEVWSQYGLTGTGVLVGSIDTGVTASNPAIAGKVARWHDFINGATTPYDDNGHGTHTVGTMVGGSTSGAPIGVAPNARVIVAKAIGANGVAPGSQLLQAAQWMTDPDGNRYNDSNEHSHWKFTKCPLAQLPMIGLSRTNGM